MNCCSEYGECRQDADCAARASSSPCEPAKVATVHKRCCTELGICHCSTPECTDPKAGFKPPPFVRWEDIHPEDPDGDGMWDEISYYGSHLLVAMMTVVVVAGGAGYLISWFGA